MNSAQKKTIINSKPRNFILPAVFTNKSVIESILQQRQRTFPETAHTALAAKRIVESVFCVFFNGVIQGFEASDVNAEYFDDLHASYIFNSFELSFSKEA